MNTPRQLHQFTLAVILKAPYLVHGNDPGRWGLDATLLRNAHGCPILPGTLLAGRVVDIWLNHGDELGSPKVDDWFGHLGNGLLAGDGGQRARLQVADLKLTKIDSTPWTQPWLAPEKPLTQTRIALDDATASVQRGAMLVTEQIAAPGQELRFEGIWHAWATQQEASTLQGQLQAALLAQTQLGADRSVGLGELVQATVMAQPAPTAPNTHLLNQNGIKPNQPLRIMLSFSEHFCITRRLHSGNLFKGGDVVPGGAILGALSASLCHAHGAARVSDLAERSALAHHFDSLRCTHAYPALQTQTARTAPIPNSWVLCGKDIKDAWRHAQPPKLAADDRAPAFQPDWKEADLHRARAVTHWADAPHHLRVRTALADGQARESMLFAYDSRYSPTGEQALHWLADFWLPTDLPAGEQQQLLQELQHLTQQQLGPIGKTDAQAQVRWNTESPQALATLLPAEQALKAGELIALRLNSPALLLDAVALSGQPITAAAAAYAAAFDDLLAQAGAPGALRYSHHFARKRLVGGDALQHRYRGGAQGAGGYRPLLLTEAGSVFVFTVEPNQYLRSVLQNWMQYGLPLPANVVQAHGSQWQDHPYIPANGYGEVVLHATQTQPASPLVPELQSAA